MLKNASNGSRARSLMAILNIVFRTNNRTFGFWNILRETAFGIIIRQCLNLSLLEETGTLYLTALLSAC